MNREAKIISAIGGVFLIIFASLIFLATKPGKPQAPEPPIDTTALIKPDSHQTLPNSSPPVTIIEFGDFQCPSCAVAHATVKELLKAYEGKINFVFKHFPLPSHNNSQISAQAAEAAGEQGKFWEVYDKLYENQDTWSNLSSPLDAFVQYAKELGLDADKFKKAVEDKKFQNIINADLADGNLSRVTATPTFFVNGERIVGAPTLEQFKAIIGTP